MGSGTGRDAGGRSTRERILDSGLHLFAEKGFTGATTKDISAKAGVNEVTLFRHFGSKKALFASVIQERSHLGEMEDGASVDMDAPVDELLERNARTVLTTLKANRHLFMIILGDAQRIPKVRGAINEFGVEKGVEFVTELMAMLIAAGKIREMDPHVAARSLIGMIQSYYMTRHLLADKEPGPGEDERVISGFVDIFLDGVRREGVK
ncbi:MAG: TetR/AcrR family transcriptional regulator [Candidatus Thermoplasmatota archaeon]|nr:TetR/AcrR family transcriptional regulator [Candidatus Thermoplasmatota archaeon]